MAHNNDSGSVLLAFMLGAMTGAAVALLLAPASGEETREYLGQKAREGRARARRHGARFESEGLGYPYHEHPTARSLRRSSRRRACRADLDPSDRARRRPPTPGGSSGRVCGGISRRCGSTTPCCSPMNS